MRQHTGACGDTCLGAGLCEGEGAGAWAAQERSLDSMCVKVMCSLDLTYNMSM